MILIVGKPDGPRSTSIRLLTSPKLVRLIVEVSGEVDFVVEGHLAVMRN